MHHALTWHDVQVRPHLEAVLGLPPDSLTKEIALCEDLRSLFAD